MMVEVRQEDRDAAEKFVVDLRCDMSGTQIHNLAGLLASTRIQSTADLQAKLDKAVEANNECLALWESCDWNATKPELNGPMYDAIQKMRKVRDAAIKGAKP